jgi:hypothetical protein
MLRANIAAHHWNTWAVITASTLVAAGFGFPMCASMCRDVPPEVKHCKLRSLSEVGVADTMRQGLSGGLDRQIVHGHDQEGRTSVRARFGTDIHLCMGGRAAVHRAIRLPTIAQRTAVLLATMATVRVGVGPVARPVPMPPLFQLVVHAE